MNFQRRTSMYSPKTTSRRVIKLGPFTIPFGRWHTFNLVGGYQYKTLLGRVVHFPS